MPLWNSALLVTKLASSTACLTCHIFTTCLSFCCLASGEPEQLHCAQKGLFASCVTVCPPCLCRILLVTSNGVFSGWEWRAKKESFCLSKETPTNWDGLKWLIVAAENYGYQQAHGLCVWNCVKWGQTQRCIYVFLLHSTVRSMALINL